MNIDPTLPNDPTQLIAKLEKDIRRSQLILGLSIIVLCLVIMAIAPSVIRSQITATPLSDEQGWDMRPQVSDRPAAVGSPTAPSTATSSTATTSEPVRMPVLLEGSAETSAP